MRTFLDALERSIVDCRELRGANWAGRSPRLGSIVWCRPKAVVVLAVVRRPSFFSKSAKPDRYLAHITST